MKNGFPNEREELESFAIRKRSSMVMSGDCRDRSDSVNQFQKGLAGLNETSKPFTSPIGMSPGFMS
jgi:hypothetical protein